MKIEASHMYLASEHTATTTYVRRETLRAWIGENRPGDAAPPAQKPTDSVRLSTTAQALAESTPAAAEITLNPEDDPALQLIIQLLERLTGRKFKVVRLGDLTARDPASEKRLQDLQDRHDGSSTAPQRAGWGIEYDRHERRHTSETMTFTASGVIHTADGHSITINLALTMARQSVEESHVQLRGGDAKLKDPLVINFTGNAAQLTNARYRFDIDADGKEENVAFVTPASGFLALDRNHDGKINDGSELFGARSGDGFAELALLDQDHNGWIDENDPAYAELRSWSKRADGQDTLSTLAEKGIGAIYLGAAASEFTLNGPDNHLQGKIRATGITLNEDGTAGTIQQIDLAI